MADAQGRFLKQLTTIPWSLSSPNGVRVGENMNNMRNFARIARRYFADYDPDFTDAEVEIQEEKPVILSDLKKRGKEEWQVTPKNRSEAFIRNRAMILPIYLKMGWLKPEDKNKIGVKISDTEWKDLLARAKNRTQEQLLSQLEKYILAVKNPQKGDEHLDSWALLTGEWKEVSPRGDFGEFLKNTLTSTAVHNICSQKHLDIDKSRMRDWLMSVYRVNAAYDLESLLPVILIRCNRKQEQILPLLKKLTANTELAKYLSDMFKDFMITLSGKYYRP